MSVLINQLSKTVTAASSSGVLTIDDTTDVWPGQIGFLSKTAVEGQRVQVIEVLSATTLRARRLPLINDPNFAKSSRAGYPSSMVNDLSEFDGGGTTFSAEQQVVGSDKDDNKLPVA